MKLRIPLLLVVVLPLVYAASPVAADPWPIKDFVPVLEQPEKLTEPSFSRQLRHFLDDWLGPEDAELQDDMARLQNAWGRLIAPYLHEMAEEYERAGFRAPGLDPIVERDGKRAYGVHVMPFEDNTTFSKSSREASGLARFGHCDGKAHANWMAINTSALGYAGVDAGDNPRERLMRLYQVLAHELFHTIQRDHDQLYQWIRACQTRAGERAWILEGMADAAAIYLTRRHFPDYTEVMYDNTDLGLRSYSENPLNDETRRNWNSLTSIKKGEFYRTSSFWLYLVERYDGLKVLNELLRHPAPKHPDKRGRLKWLDEALRQSKTIRADNGGQPKGLYHVFPEFITEFASYGGFRFRNFAGKKHQDTVFDINQKWLKGAFTRCLSQLANETAHIHLTPDDPVKEVSGVYIEPMSADCYRVSWKGFPSLVKERVEVLGEDLRGLDAIHLGTAYMYTNGDLVVCYKVPLKGENPIPACLHKPFNQTGPRLGEYAKQFRTSGVDSMFRPDGFNGWKIYVVTNASKDPWKGKEMQYTFRVGFDTVKVKGKKNLAPPTTKGKNGGGRNPDPKERSYGIVPPGPHIPENAGLEEMTFDEYTSDEPRSGEKPEKRYQVIPARGKLAPRYGQTGPFYGTVWLNYLDGAHNKKQLLNSGACADPDDPPKPIGRIVESTEDQLIVNVAADICKCDPSRDRKCPPGRVVDRFDGTVTLASAWRHYRETQPGDLVTPGMKAYIDRYYDKLPGLLARALHGDEERQFREGYGDPYARLYGLAEGGGRTTTPDGSGSPGAGCACSCEAFSRMQDMQRQGSTTQRARAARCMSICATEYRACR